ncbi:glycosyltransferase [Falsiroseomonas tokyonensis]|uniref:Glycosyltransferase n=1 Tax=Falsiroseomonas tokyonensis TaxID=430521 RepID=A0ABV7C081_9PROT|nr:glycosyltransferase [Falsiroseomonas tokyonensis]MBU8541082.1 glycosyltransferase [Falsiroseomonas tokyonensis]
MSESNPELALKDGSARAAPKSPAWAAGLVELLFGRADAAQLPNGARDPLTAARALLLSDAFAETVLGPLAAGRAPPQAARAAIVPEAPRRLAETHIFAGRLQLSGASFAEPWPRFLLRLLTHEDSALRLGAAGWQAAPAESAQTRLAELTQAALRAQAAQDPLLRHRVFTTAAAPLGVDTLFRYVLGRPPTARDNLQSSAREGYHSCIRRFLLAPEFDRNVLTPLRDGKPPQHAAQPPLEPGHLAMLQALFGRPEVPVEDWSAELMQFLGQADLITGLIGPTAALNPKQRAVASRLRAVVAVADTAAAPGASRLPVATRWRDGRVLVVHVDPAQVAMAEPLRCPMRLELTAPRVMALDFKPERIFRGLLEASVTVPLLALAPHAIEGELLLYPSDAPDAAPLARLPVYVEMPAEAIEAILARKKEELDRAGFLAHRGRTGDALKQLDAMLADAPAWAQPRALALSLRLISGTLDPEAALQEIAAAPRDPALSRLAVALRLRAGAAAEALRLLDSLPATTEPAWRVLQAVIRHRATGQAGNSLDGLAPDWAQHLLLALFAPGARAAMPASALGALPPDAVRVALARGVVQAMAIAFLPPRTVAETVQAFDRAELLGLAQLCKDALAQEWMAQLLPALGLLPAESIPDPWVQLSAARVQQALGQFENAMALTEAVLRRKPAEMDALMLGATLKHRLGETEEAIRLLDRALLQKPKDARLSERVLALELDLNKREPLRSRQRADRLMAQLLEVRQRELAGAPGDVQTRYEYARTVAMAERFDEAIPILESLAEAAPEELRYKIELMRLGQLAGDHKTVLRWFRAMKPEERDERATVWAIRAHRGLGEVEEAQALLDDAGSRDSGQMQREYVRNLFFTGHFDRALEAAEAAIERAPADLELRLLAAAVNLETGNNARAAQHVDWTHRNGGAAAYPLEMPLFRYAVAHKAGDTPGALRCLDPMFARVGAQPVLLDRSQGAQAFDQLVGSGRHGRFAGPFPPVFDGPLVSVIMTSYNVETYLPTAARSILQQSYRNLELIIVDDASTDRTPQILMELERSDPRVKVILKTTNDGTYVSKNTGMLQAQGEFIALQDSDDWSHPDRLASSISVLLRRPDVMGLTTDWLRMTSDGDIVIKAGGQISHLCCISLVFRRAPVLDKVGFFDSVRIAADLEFIQRIGLTWGARAVPRLRWPLLFGRARSDSLTASEEFGISRTGFTEPRHIYHENSESFHARIKAGEPAYMPFPLRVRPFVAPKIILPVRES